MGEEIEMIKIVDGGWLKKPRGDPWGPSDGAGVGGVWEASFYGGSGKERDVAAPSKEALLERLALFWAEGDNAQRFPECLASVKVRQEPGEDGRGMFIRKILGRLTPTHPKMLEWLAGEEKRKLESAGPAAEPAARGARRGV